VAELFGAVGVGGIAAVPLTGRLAGRPGPRLVTTLGALPTLRAGAVFGLWPGLFGLVLGVSILAFGVVQSALVSNQHVIYAFQPDTRSRLNTIFMTGMFLGGAAGSAGPEWPSTAHLSRRKEELRRAGTC
jgi:predicted MFS family arabinose efflux permease